MNYFIKREIGFFRNLQKSAISSHFSIFEKSWKPFLNIFQQLCLLRRFLWVIILRFYIRCKYVNLSDILFSIISMRLGTGSMKNEHKIVVAKLIVYHATDLDKGLTVGSTHNLFESYHRRKRCHWEMWETLIFPGTGSVVTPLHVPDV